MKLLIEFDIKENSNKEDPMIYRSCAIVNYTGRLTKKAIGRLLKANPKITRMTKFTGYSEGTHGTLLNSERVYDIIKPTT